ncbi:MAG: Crp/Fnr family transcriptional regulator [Janthinobacterium lividum]
MPETNYMSALIAAIQTLTPISVALENALEATVQYESLPARHQLLKPGQIARRIYFLEKGLVRGYALQAGQEISSWFMCEGDFVISIVSFFTQQPSTEYLELLESGTLYSIEYAQLDILYRTFPEFNYVGRVLTERYYVQSEQRAYQLRTLSAKERYTQIVKNFPFLLQRVPLKYLASHLGMTPETLSRMRAKR